MGMKVKKIAEGAGGEAHNIGLYHVTIDASNYWRGQPMECTLQQVLRPSNNFYLLSRAKCLESGSSFFLVSVFVPITLMLW